MFQYTTETIINSNEGKLEGGKRFMQADDYIIIDGVNTFKSNKIEAIYHSPYRPAVKATATITIPSSLPVTLAAEDVIRLTVVLSETGNVRSTIQNAYLHHTKPFHFELKVTTPNTVDVDNLVEIIKKQMRDTDFNYFSAKKESGNLVLTADDCYIQFDEVRLDKVVDTAIPGGYAGTHSEKIVAVKAGDTDIVRGDQGAGTVARLVKDLRIPTGASINPFGADQGGRPVPGGKYDQYLFEYVTDRRHVAGGVVGSLNQSLTSHIFFIEAGAKADWDTMLTNAGLTPAEAGRGLVESATPGVLEEASPKNPNVSVVDAAAGEIELNAKTPDVGSVQ